MKNMINRRAEATAITPPSLYFVSPFSSRNYNYFPEALIFRKNSRGRLRRSYVAGFTGRIAMFMALVPGLTLKFKQPFLSLAKVLKG